MAWSPRSSASSASASRSSMLRGLLLVAPPEHRELARELGELAAHLAQQLARGPLGQPRLGEIAAAPPQRDRCLQHVADRDAPLQEARRLARRHEVAPGEALVDRLQHVEQHQAGDEVGAEPGQPLDLGAAHAAVDLLGRRQQAERAAQHVLADQRRRSRQARRQGDAPVVERAVDRRMAEGDQGDGAAGPRRELALAQAHQRVEAAPRQSLDAADEEERLTGEGHELRPLPARRLARRGLLRHRLARRRLGGRRLGRLL